VFYQISRRALHVAGTALLLLSNEGAASDDTHHSEHLLDTIGWNLNKDASCKMHFSINCYRLAADFEFAL
jgi:hypothetical protein